MQDWLATLNASEVVGVLMTFDTHVADIYATSPEAEQFPLHCEKGRAGWESVLDRATIDPAIPIYTLEKGVFDMWAEPDLAIRSRDGTRMNRDVSFGRLAASGVDRVVVAGVATDFCVRWAVEGLMSYDPVMSDYSDVLYDPVKHSLPYHGSREIGQTGEAPLG